MSDMLETKNQIDELFDVLAEQLREEVTAKVTSEVTSEVRSEVTAEVRSEVTAELTADALERLQRKTTQTYTAIDDSETAPGATNGDMNREFTSKSHFTST
jgi:molybdopterin-binding protein